MASPVRRPDLSELAALVAAIEEASLAGAARRLHLTGPAIAKRIRNLETLAGTALLERSERGVVPTARGRTVYADAQRLLADADALFGTARELRIAGVQSFLGSRTPRSEQLLHATEELFAQVFHTSPDAIIVSRFEDGTIIEANDAFCRLSGYDAGELYGRTGHDLGLWAVPEHRARIVAQLRSDAAAHGEATLRRRDETVVDVSFLAHVLDVHGQRTLFIRIADETERRKCAETFVVHERRHTALSELAVSLLGGAPFEAVAKRALALVSREFGPAAIVACERPPRAAATSGRGAKKLARLVERLGAPLGPDPSVAAVAEGVVALQRIPVLGRPQLVLATLAPPGFEFGGDELATLRGVASLTGISIGWKRSTAAVVGLLAHVPDAVLVVDDGNRVVAANRAAEALLGAEVVGTPLSSLVAADEGAWRTLLDEGSIEKETAVIAAGGDVCRVRLQATADLAPGRHLVVLARERELAAVHADERT
ncbi:MAG: PAS domain-containing protein [Actinomycetota bacterium]